MKFRYLCAALHENPEELGPVEQFYMKNCMCIYMYIGVSKNNGTPKSSTLIGISIINHPFWGTPIFGNTHIYIIYIYICFLSSIQHVYRDFRGAILSAIKISYIWNKYPRCTFMRNTADQLMWQLINWSPGEENWHFILATSFKRFTSRKWQCFWLINDNIWSIYTDNNIERISHGCCLSTISFEFEVLFSL